MMDDGAADFGFSIAGRVAVALFIILLLLVAYFIAWETVSRSVRLSHVEANNVQLANELGAAQLELEGARRALAALAPPKTDRVLFVAGERPPPAPSTPGSA